jgi:hypothetical protein
VAVRRLAKAAAPVGLGLLVLVGPALAVDWASVAWKLGGHGITTVTLVHGIELLAGTRHWWLIAGLGIALLAGLAATARAQARLVSYLSFLSVAQLLCVLVGRPAYLDVPITLVRYNLTLLPVTLVLVAVGVTGLGGPRGRAVAVRRGLVGALVSGLLLAFGPLPDIHARPSNWTNHGMFQYAYAPNTPWAYAFLRPPAMSPFYRALAGRRRDSVKLVEVPTYYEWQKTPYPNYQRVHGQRMFAGMVEDPGPVVRAGELPLTRPGARFENFVHVADHVGLLRRGVTFVVFHRDLASEVPGASFERIDVGRWVEHYRRVYGAPAYEDRHLIVFDVTRRRPEWPS